MKKILIVDDEIKIVEMIRKYALLEGYEVVCAENGEVAFEMCLLHNIDLVIMDIMMPVMDGFSASRKIKEYKDIPIILLSALDAEYDKIRGFELGIDDYVTKPFSNKELMLRANAILKRNLKTNIVIYNIDELEINVAAHSVKINKENIKLSPKEFDLLLYLVENEGIVLSRDKILQKIWGYDFFGDDRTLDTHIKLLRKNLKDYGSYIVTLRGVGYRFEKQS